MSLSTCAIIIVTYNSEKYISHCIAHIEKQTLLPSQVIIVDTGSSDLSYLAPYQKHNFIKVVIAEKESGFCKGNNIGMQALVP